MSVTRSVPPSPAPSTPATPVDQRRAKRDLLRDFYGLKGTAASPRAQTSDPLDIGASATLNPSSANYTDSPNFSAQQYYQHLVASASLPQLLEKTTSLSSGEQTMLTPLTSDIGNLKSARHSLVYNHHHELFSAGDTIAHLNHRTPELLGILAELQQTFSDIERAAESVTVPPEKAKTSKQLEVERIMALPETLGLMLDAGGEWLRRVSGC
jgi:hypothetical protein